MRDLILSLRMGAPLIVAQICSGNGLVHDGTGPLPEPVLPNNQWGAVPFIGGQFHRKCWRYTFLIWIWKMLTWDCSNSSQARENHFDIPGPYGWPNTCPLLWHDELMPIVWSERLSWKCQIGAFLYSILISGWVQQIVLPSVVRSTHCIIPISFIDMIIKS